MNALDVLLVGTPTRAYGEDRPVVGTKTAPGGTRIHAGSINEVRDVLRDKSPDLVVIDEVPPDADPTELLLAIRNRGGYLPVIQLVDENGSSTIPPVLRKRADHQMSRTELLDDQGTNLGELIEESDPQLDDQLRRLELDLIEETNVDLLTKLPDGAALMDQLEEFLSGKGRSFVLVSVLVDDRESLDRDRQCRFLEWTADLLTVTVGEEDLVYREGHSHFCVIAPSDPIHRSLNLARTLKDELRELGERLGRDPEENPMHGIGLANASSTSISPKKLIRSARGYARRNKTSHEPTVGGVNELLSCYLNQFFRRKSL